MKTIILFIALLAIPISGQCFNGTQLNKQIMERQQAMQKAASEQANKEASEQEAIRDAESKKAISAYIAEQGVGWAYTAKEAVDLRQSASGDFGVYDVLKLMNTDDAKDNNALSKFGYSNARGVSAKLEGLLQRFPGSTAEAASGTGLIIVGNKKYAIKDRNLFRYEEEAENGLHYRTTWDDTKNIVTVEISDKSSSMLAKININEPKKTRIMDANFPIKANAALIQIFNDIDISLSENVILTMIENFYNDKIMPSGETLQKTMTELLSNPDARVQFLKYCQEKAIPMKKAAFKKSTIKY